MLRFRSLRRRAGKLKKRLTLLYYASGHPDLPRRTKILVALTVAYALSPIDLIPDFIPLLGYLDDLLILPALIALCLKSIPPEIWHQAASQALREPLRLNKNWKAGAIILLIWAAVLIKLISPFIG